jgi:hypothetical protein
MAIMLVCATSFNNLKLWIFPTSCIFVYVILAVSSQVLRQLCISSPTAFASVTCVCTTRLQSFAFVSWKKKYKYKLTDKILLWLNVEWHEVTTGGL